MDHWASLVDILVLLMGGLVLGTLAERLKQSAILGYLAAGTLLGPNALGFVSHEETVHSLADMGVALLLFTIGLEFSWRRLVRMGNIVLLGGLLQVLVTIALTAALCMAMGLTLPQAVTIGAMVAMSSTATVLRVLIARAQIESFHGRLTLGVLLMQDVLVVPLVLLVTLIGGRGTATQAMGEAVKSIALAGGLVAVFHVLFNHAAPRALGTAMMTRNRDLPVLLAVVAGLGSAWVASRLALSPALGAFVAGLLLAESPFATQIRSDVLALRTLLVTLFFTSIGMLAQPAWIASHWASVLALTAAIVAGKAIIVWPLLRAFGQSHQISLSTGLCLAQVGEFSFVLAEVARGKSLDEDLFLLLISATIGTLVLTPLLTAHAPRLASGVLRATGWVRDKAIAPHQIDPGEAIKPDVLIVGFGPAGQAVGQTLVGRDLQVSVVDLNPRSIALARELGFHRHLGDAGSLEVLQHAGAAEAKVVVVTLPDPDTARQVIQHLRVHAPQARLVVRARYHVYRWELEFAGAHVVIDEEQHVGERLAAELRMQLTQRRRTGGA